MRFDSIFLLFFLSLLTVAIVHKLALVWHLYWIYPMLDIPVHFLAGTTIALGLGSRVFERFVPGFMRTFAGVFLAVTSVGLLWEVFEWYFVLVDTVAYFEDTILDVIMDVAGGTVGFWIVQMFNKTEL